MKNIYTIGHSNHDLDFFLKLLKNCDINCIVDVRSVPFSKYVPYYNKDNIKHTLNKNSIYCIYMGEELGVVKDDLKLMSKDGYLDFNKVKKTEGYNIGIERIKLGLTKGFNIAIMCTEKDPLDCHRSILIGRELSRQNFNVLHIHEDSSTEDTYELEKRLLKLYFPESPQQSLFNVFEDEQSQDSLLEKAYLLRNKDIGYRPEKKL